MAQILLVLGQRDELGEEPKDGMGDPSTKEIPLTLRTGIRKF